MLTLTAACSTTSAPPPPERLLEPLTALPAHAPETADLLAVAVAEASLAGDREAAMVWLHELKSELEREAEARRQSTNRELDPATDSREVLERDEGRSALLPLAIDLANAAGDDYDHPL